jgi:hypothetical protein
VVPAVAAALATGVGSASATVPPGLSVRTAVMVFDFLTGGPAVAGSPPVVLAKGVATTMLTRKLMALTVTVSVGLIGLGVVPAGDERPGAAPATAAPAVKRRSPHRNRRSRSRFSSCRPGRNRSTEHDSVRRPFPYRSLVRFG